MQLRLSEILDILENHKVRNLHEDPEKLVVKSFAVNSKFSEGGSVFFALKGKRTDGHEFVKEAYLKGAKIAIVEREIIDVEIIQVIVSSVINALGILAKNIVERTNPTIIEITGSNGKTTTKEIIYHLLNSTTNSVFRNPGNLNTEVGLPLSILNYYDQEKIVILELGISKPGDMDRLISILKPSVGVFLNSGSAHIGNFRDENQIFFEKSKLIRNIEKGIAVLYADDERFIELASKLKDLKVFFFGCRKGNVRLLDWKHDLEHFVTMANFETFGKPLFLNLNGIWNRGQLLDFGAAMCVVRALGFDIDLNTLRNFRPPENRFNVQRIGNFIVIDDTYNSSLESLKVALNTINNINAKRKIAILGAILEQGEKSQKTHERLGKLIVESNIDYVIVYSIFPDIEYSIDNMKDKVVIKSSNLNEIVDFLYSFLQPGDLIYFKASRGVEMERVIEKIWKIFSS